MRAPRWPAWAWAVAALALVAHLVLGGLFPEADPQWWMPFGLPSTNVDEFLVEPAAKAHEARNWALFGAWHRNPADNYQFWRVQSPVWVYPLAWAFAAFGTTYTTLHLVSLAWGGLAFAGVVAVLRQLVPGWAGAAAASVLALDYFAVLVARAGFIEIVLAAAGAWMVLSLLRARHHPGWLVASQLLFALGFFAKQGMVVWFPVLLVANLAVFASWRRAERFAKLRWLPVATAAVLALAATAYVLQPDYLRTLLWNADHMLGQASLRELDNVYPWWVRFDGLRLWWTTGALVPGLGPLALAGSVWLGWRALRAAPGTEGRGADLLLVAWYLSAFVGLTLARTWMIRHQSLLIAPAVVVVARMAVEVVSARALRAGPLVGLLFGLSVAFNVALHIRRVEHTTYEIATAAKAVTARIGDEPAVVVGRFAMPVLLATPYDLFYVKEAFNTEPERIRALQISHALLWKDEDTSRLLTDADRRFSFRTRLGNVEVGPRILFLRAFPAEVPMGPSERKRRAGNNAPSP